MRTLILGLDAFDPTTFERLYEDGRLPNLARYVDADRYARLGVTDPPQSEVSWTSIATGLNPGAHGIFDFVHREPASYSPFLSLLPTESGLGGTRFASPTQARTLFDQAAAKGYSATSLWWPATFPAKRGSPVRTIPGLGTPDIHGKLGVGTLFSQDRAYGGELNKTDFSPLERKGAERFCGELLGPARKKRGGTDQAAISFELEFVDDDAARLMVGDEQIELRLGEWSPLFEVRFKMGWFVTIRALTRVILTQVRPSVRLYVLPLQLHPLHSPWPYGTPPGFVKETWNASGPFLSAGWPQDTTGLEEGCIDDDQFLALCDSIFEARSRAFFHHLAGFEEGVLAAVFDSLDRVQHMFWRDHPDVIEEWYEKLDALVGRVEHIYGSANNAQFLVVSDHGFSDFHHKVHLNRWLLEQDYLTITSAEGESGKFGDVDWQKTRIYALGLNSLYLNMAGREGGGIVSSEQSQGLLDEVAEKLTTWRGPNQDRVVQRVLRRDEAFSGPLRDHAPDLVIGYRPGYRASAETGLGGWGEQALVANRDHWGADHCIDGSAVPGVIFARHGLAQRPSPSYSDVPWLAIGAEPDDSVSLPPPTVGAEDMQQVEDRLRSLGYL